MFHARDKIDKLVNGYVPTTYERCLILKLENELENLLAEREAKRQLLQRLTDQDELAQAEFQGQMAASKGDLEEIKDKLQAYRKKTKILSTYLDHIKSEEFCINALKVETLNYVKEFHQNLKPIVDKARRVSTGVSQIRMLHEKCCALQHQVPARAPAN